LDWFISREFGAFDRAHWIIRGTEGNGELICKPAGEGRPTDSMKVEENSSFLTRLSKVRSELMSHRVETGELILIRRCVVIRV
jgi:hypothetical protein